MLNKKSIKKLSFLLLMLFLISGCSLSLNGTDKDIGGVFKTVDMGENWVNMSAIPTSTGEPQSIAGINANTLVMDPSDNKALYLGSASNGLFYTYDRAQNWAISYELGRVPINAIAIDHNSKCTIYSSSANKLYKSTDCSRNWIQAYYDNNLAVSVNSIATDHYNSNHLYIGTSRGEIIKSQDGGTSWQTINRFNNPIKKIALSPHDSRIIMVAVGKNGIYRSEDSGQSWTDLETILKNFNSEQNFKDLIISTVQSGLVFLATDYGLLKSNDYGYGWRKIELITPEKDASINAIAVGAVNPDIIYYVTNTTFHGSIDGGFNWTTKKLPSARAGWNLVIDPDDDKIVYMGVKFIEEQGKRKTSVFGI